MEKAAGSLGDILELNISQLRQIILIIFQLKDWILALRNLITN